MTDLNSLNIITMTQAFVDNKDTIQLYMSNPEMFQTDQSVNESRILGMAVGIFVFVYLLILVVFAWSLYAIIKYWNKIPVWARLTSIVFLFIFPIISLVVVYGSLDDDYSSNKERRSSKSKKSRD
jgi:hypothetical protein